MKMNKLIAASALAVAITGVASAATVVRISGATAFRAATHNAIAALMTGETIGYTGTSFTGAGEAIFKGAVSGVTGDVVIITKWSGSVGGIEDIAKDRIHGDASYPGSTRWLADVAGNYTGGTIASPVRDSANNTADVAMSDSKPSSTGITGNAMTSIPVGVVPFFFVKGSSNNTDAQAVLNKITGITALQAQALLSGLVQGSVLTGDEADAGVYLLPVGRNAESGTRLGTFAESGFGIFGTPTQFTTTIAGGVITKVVGDPTGGGYSSGGNVATALSTPVAADALVNLDGSVGGDIEGLPFGLIGYVGLSDIIAKGLTGNILAWNGVAIPASATATLADGNFDFSLLRSGKYTFWTYEQLAYRSSFAGDKKTVADALATKIKTLVTAPSGLIEDTLSVLRSVEGGVVTHK